MVHSHTLQHINYNTPPLLQRSVCWFPLVLFRQSTWAMYKYLMLPSMCRWCVMNYGLSVDFGTQKDTWKRRIWSRWWLHITQTSIVSTHIRFYWLYCVGHCVGMSTLSQASTTQSRRGSSYWSLPPKTIRGSWSTNTSAQQYESLHQLLPYLVKPMLAPTRSDMRTLDAVVKRLLCRGHFHGTLWWNVSKTW